ncbi:hypothetical protein WDW37_13910 [Bdellovibrionota bacterium FG-1]
MNALKLLTFSLCLGLTLPLTAHAEGFCQVRRSNTQERILTFLPDGQFRVKAVYAADANQNEITIITPTLVQKIDELTLKVSRNTDGFAITVLDENGGELFTSTLSPASYFHFNFLKFKNLFELSCS